ncbi:hypothetical protein GCM10009527_062120 [Actinomadura nitritigenes]
MDSFSELSCSVTVTVAGFGCAPPPGLVGLPVGLPVGLIGLPVGLVGLPVGLVGLPPGLVGLSVPGLVGLSVPGLPVGLVGGEPPGLGAVVAFAAVTGSRAPAVRRTAPVAVEMVVLFINAGLPGAPPPKPRRCCRKSRSMAVSAEVERHGQGAGQGRVKRVKTMPPVSPIS